MFKNISTLRYFAFAFIFLCSHLATASAPQITIDTPTLIEQGHAFVMKITAQPDVPEVRITWRDKTFTLPLTITPDHVAQAGLLLGMPYDAQNGLPLVVKYSGNSMRALINPKKVTWTSEKLRLKKAYVTPPSKVSKRIQEERAVIQKVLQRITPKKHYGELPFVRPVKGIVTSGYGKKRLINGEVHSIHKGVDFRGATGVPIKAMADGVVALSDNLYYSGNAVFIDHGLGLISLYAHLSASHVKTGDTVKAGQVIGLVGATGRVTGPHLHLSVYNFGETVNPLPLFTAKTKK